MGGDTRPSSAIPNDRCNRSTTVAAGCRWEMTRPSKAPGITAARTGSLERSEGEFNELALWLANYG